MDEPSRSAKRDDPRVKKGNEAPSREPQGETPHARTHLVFATALLACTLAVPLAVDAGPRTRPPAPQPAPMSVLTSTERLCRTLGLYAYDRAVERDRGYTLSDGLLLMRHWAAKLNVQSDTRQLLEGIHQHV